MVLLYLILVAKEKNESLLDVLHHTQVCILVSVEVLGNKTLNKPRINYILCITLFIIRKISSVQFILVHKKYDPLCSNLTKIFWWGKECGY